VKQLAAQIDKQIRIHEGSLETMPRTEATRHRATLIKLTRDYHRVETNYKNIVLETRRKRSLMEARRREEDDYENRKKLESEFIDDNMKQLQIQQQNDVRHCWLPVVYKAICHLLIFLDQSIIRESQRKSCGSVKPK
jgi:hypothetical protein